MRFTYFAIVSAIVAFAFVQGSPLVVQKPIKNVNELETLLETYAFEKEINATIECVRKILEEGDEELNIPSIDPLQIENVDLDFDKLGLENVTGLLNLKDFNIVGLAKWRASHLKVTISLVTRTVKVEITMLFPGSSFEGKYNGDVTVLDQNIKGEGSISGSFENLEIAVKLQAAIDKQIKLRSLSIKPSIESLKFNIDNVLVNGVENNEIINNAVESFPQWLQDNQNEIDSKLSKLIMDDVNNMKPGEGGGEEGIINDIITILNKKCKL